MEHNGAAFFFPSAKMINFPKPHFGNSKKIALNSPVGHFRNAEHLSGVCVFPSSVADVQMLDGPGRDGFSHRQENGDYGRVVKST